MLATGLIFKHTIRTPPASVSTEKRMIRNMAVLRNKSKLAGCKGTERPRPWSVAPPTSWEAFKRDPTRTTAMWLCRKWPKPLCHRAHPGTQPGNAIKAVCVSDTHGRCPDIPAGDLFLHAGDLTTNGTFSQVQEQLNWIKSLPHRHKVIIAGNHDFLLDPAMLKGTTDPALFKTASHLDWGDIVYLENSSTCLTFPNGRKLNIFGSPLTPSYGSWAFQYPAIRDVWGDKIPPDTDILLTHGPAKGFLDQGGKGCEHLLREIWRKRPSLVVHGHIHSGYGQQDITYSSFETAYTAVLSGQRGAVAVVQMTVQLLFETVLNALRIPRRRERPAHTTFVNVAATIDRTSEETRPAVVIEI